MKLHLPKQLFTALLAAITMSSAPFSQAAEMKFDINRNGDVVKYNFVDAEGVAITSPGITMTYTDYDFVYGGTNGTGGWETPEHTNYTNTFSPNVQLRKDTTDSWTMNFTLNFSELNTSYSGSDDNDVVGVVITGFSFKAYAINGGGSNKTDYVPATGTITAGDSPEVSSSVTLEFNGRTAEIVLNLADPISYSAENPSLDCSFKLSGAKTHNTYAGLTGGAVLYAASIQSDADVTWTNGADASWSGESWETTAGTTGIVKDASVGNATFADAAGGSHTVTVDAAATAKSIAVNSGNYTFAAGSYTANEVETPGTLSITNGMTINEGASATFNVVTTLAGTVSNAGTLNMGSFTVEEGNTATFSGTGTTTLAGTISGAGKLIKTGTGELVLSGANTYSGGTEITGGTLTTSNGSALGSGAVTLNNGTLKLGADLSIASLTEQSNSTLTLDGHTLTVQGALTTTNGMTFGTVGTAAAVGPGGKLTVRGVLTANGQLQFAAYACSADDLSGLTLRLEGVGNEITKLDMGNSGNARGTLELAADSTTQVYSTTLVTTLFLRDKATISLENGATLKLLGSEKLQFKGRESGSAVNNSGATGQYSYTNTGYSFENGDVTVNTASNGEGLSNKLVNSSLTNTGSGELTVSNSANTITALSAENGNVKLSASMKVDSISAKSGKMVTVTNGNTIAMGGGAVSIGANGANATLTARSDTALAQLQEDASFTIQDMTLTNTTITAATVETKVNLQNVEASNVMLAKGAFTLNATPTVGLAPSGEGHGTLSYSNGLAIATTDNIASLTLNLDVVNAVAGDAHGTYDLTITLSGFGDGFAVTEAILGLVGFDSTSWLGQALVSQKAEYTVVTEQTPATAGEGGVPTVSYAAGTGASVGSLVITISGLNVPEPATSTLSLLALAALAARRRRK